MYFKTEFDDSILIVYWVIVLVVKLTHVQEWNFSFNI